VTADDARTASGSGREAEEREHLRLAARIAGVEVTDARPPESRWLTLGPMRFHCVEWESAARLPVLFLHGGCLNARTWDVVCLALRECYRCLALDQRGHGDSDWSASREYTIEAHLHDLEMAADALGLDRFVLVGHSMGGVNAISYAASHPERVAALVLVDVGPEFREAGGAQIRRFVTEVPRASTLDDFVERAVAFNPYRDRRLLRRSLQHNLKPLPDGRWAWKYDPALVGRFDLAEMAARMRRLWGLVPRIDSPTLVVRGARSTIYLDEDAATRARALPLGHWCRIDDAGHNVQGDNPRALAEAIVDFLRGVSLPPSASGDGAQ
jgi:pimeloyl-ACP methyl ester carboxylesterase